MTTREDVESFIIQLGADVEEVAHNMWVVRAPDDGTPVVFLYDPPVLLLRLKVLGLPEGADEARLAPFFRRLLELNAGEVVHGNYGLEEGEVILSDALELESLDFHEVRSSYESLLLAASTHVAELSQLLPVAHGS